MMRIMPYLRAAVEKSASDIFFTANAPALVRVDGELNPVDGEVLSGDTIALMAEDVMTPGQKARLESHMEVDFASQAGGLGRFRVNVFRQRGHVAMVWRYVKDQVPTIDELRLPPAIEELVLFKRGLVLVVGATGSGKSTTLAAMIGYRNRRRGGHILTVEDPIEFVHANHRSIVNQREVGVDTQSYPAALQSALRESPDVVMIGEIRERTSMAATLQLAGTGHLVLSTLHANNAYQTLQRILTLFPEDMRDQIHMDLALNLRAVVSQRLVRTRSGGRIPAVEIMVNTPLISDLIVNGRIDEIRDAMDGSSKPEMQTFDDSLYKLYRSGLVDLNDVLESADSRSNLESRINFGS